MTTTEKPEGMNQQEVHERRMAREQREQILTIRDRLSTALMALDIEHKIELSDDEQQIVVRLTPFEAALAVYKLDR